MGVPVTDDEIVSGIGLTASNMVGGTNPSYTIANFVAMYPQFTNPGGAISDVIIQIYINLATATVQHDRWLDAWEVGMSLFVAHFLTLHIMGTASAGSPAATVIASGQARGLTTSRSAGDVSASTDYNLVGQDLNGWAAWKLTIYGTQYATLAKIIGMGGMYVR